jgi:hypothetical protein
LDEPGPEGIGHSFSGISSHSLISDQLSDGARDQLYFEQSAWDIPFPVAGLSFLTTLPLPLFLGSLAMPSSKASWNILASPVRIVFGSGTGVQLESELVGEDGSDPDRQQSSPVQMT